MGIKKVQINSRRVFSEEFKKARVKEYESGKFTVNELGRLFGLQPKVIYRWIYKYSVYNKKSVKVVEMKDIFGILLKSREPEQLGGRVLHGTLYTYDGLPES